VGDLLNGILQFDLIIIKTKCETFVNEILSTAELLFVLTSVCIDPVAKVFDISFMAVQITD
jgi:hypothetical protein